MRQDRLPRPSPVGVSRSLGSSQDPLLGAIAGRDGGIAFRHAGDGGSDYRHRLRGFDFGSLAAPIPLAEIYRGVQFPETPNH